MLRKHTILVIIPSMDKQRSVNQNLKKALYVFLFTTFWAELFLVFIMPHFLAINSSSRFKFFLNGSIRHYGNILGNLNPALQSFWAAEIIGLLVTAIYVLSNHRFYRLRAIVSPLISGLMGIYGILFGFYYTPYYPASFNIRAGTDLPYLFRANLWLIGGLAVGWLIGKGLEPLTKSSNNIPIASRRPQIQMSDDYWKQKLTRRQYNIARNKATEIPFTGRHNYNHRHGAYACVACGQQLFSSSAKFNSYSGWPSFTDPVNAKNVILSIEKNHKSLGMAITEVSCANCGAHLGHLFNDGPVDKGGDRYCINSTVLDFKPTKSVTKLI
jgi:peptide-methionine (R)-S-oxide reductase